MRVSDEEHSHRELLSKDNVDDTIWMIRDALGCDINPAVETWVWVLLILMRAKKIVLSSCVIYGLTWPIGVSRFEYDQIRAPVGKVYFTGEHTSEHYNGYVHGAYLSGIDSANLLIKYHKKSVQGSYYD